MKVRFWFEHGYNEKEVIISDPERSNGRFNADRLRSIGINIEIVGSINSGKDRSSINCGKRCSRRKDNDGSKR